MLFDAVVTAPLEAYWTGLALNKSEYGNNLTLNTEDYSYEEMHTNLW